MQISTKYLTNSAIIAAVYVALTLLLAPISFGAVQLRVAEALTVLPMLTPAAIPGLFAGCLIANIYTGSMIDIVFGSLATLLAAVMTYRTRDRVWLAPFFPVIINAVVVGGYIGLYFTDDFPVLLTMVLVGAGQLAACYGIGLPLYRLMKKMKIKF